MRGRVPSTRTARVARIAAAARTTRSARPWTAVASARPAIAARTATSCALRTPSARIARRSAPARTGLAARPRTDAATVRPVREIQYRASHHLSVVTRQVLPRVIVSSEKSSGCGSMLVEQSSRAFRIDVSWLCACNRV